ncbi:isotrichodermin C-15 hydroxylase protein [Rutstroemia sp. NJR-2017a BBW]|nr:isotrichodermin C-15 hydroxylase protein [Rutstroemia sp. NJR-2017a BBW]
MLSVPIALAAIGLFVFYWGSIFFYNVFLHPLRGYPGPKLWAASNIPISYWRLRGCLPYKIKELHDKYGSVVRVAPIYLDYNSSTAWEQIYGFAKNGKGNFPKDLKDRTLKGERVNITRLVAGTEDHRRLRRLQSHMFSDKALASQESLIQVYTDQFVNGLIKFSSKSTDHSINLGHWYNFATFDVIGDLAFGEPFGCLQTGVLHPWIDLIFKMFKISNFISEARKYPPIGPLLLLLTPASIRDKLQHHRDLAREKAERRMATETDRPDFMTYILRHNDAENGMTPEEIKENANILILAGSETTATLLNGLTYFLLQNPTTLNNLTLELRNKFKSRSELTLLALASCKYLNAVLEEGLRMYPPVPINLPRLSPPSGTTIEEKYVPGGVTIGVSQWAANYATSNFHDPYSFHPERWLNAEQFARDDKKARQPFSFGPANCIGKNLAYAEMRVLLANLVWGFNLEAGEGADTWLERNEIYGLWKKPKLNVKLTRVNV